MGSFETYRAPAVLASVPRPEAKANYAAGWSTGSYEACETRSEVLALRPQLCAASVEAVRSQLCQLLQGEREALMQDIQDLQG